MRATAWKCERWVAALLPAALLTLGCVAQARAADSSTVLTGVKIVDNPTGGRIYFGQMTGQPTPAEAMGRVLQRVTALCGDRPQLGKLVRNTAGDVLAAFFSVNGANLDGKPLEGLAIVYAPKTGSAGGAVLLDDATRFPTTVNPMFTKLKEELGASPSSGTSANPSASSPKTAAAKPASSGSVAVKPGKAQPLQSYPFPDGTGTIRLPAGWQVGQAHMGDVTASGPHGETLRFGWAVPVMGDSRSAALGNFVAIPYEIQPADAFKAIMAQIFQKARKPPPTIDISKVRELPSPGVSNNFLYGDIDVHDGKGQQFLVVEMISGPPMQQMMGARDFKFFMVLGPQQVMAEEAATIAAIYSGYGQNTQQLNRVANTEIQQGIAQTNQFTHTVSQYMDSSDRATAGMSNVLREQTVIVDTRTGAHATTSDGLAGAFISANPNRFQAVSPSEYTSGIDY